MGLSLELCVRNQPTMCQLLQDRVDAPNVCREHGPETAFISWCTDEGGVRGTCTDGGRGCLQDYISSRVRLPHHHNPLALATNAFPAEWQKRALPEECRAFLRQYLQPSAALRDACVRARQHLGLESAYDVLHVRCGDPVGSRNVPRSQQQQIDGIIQHVRASSRNPIVIISDNPDLRTTLAVRHQLRTLGITRACHLAKSSGDVAAARDTMVDYMLMADAAAIWQISSYWWGSGFSESAAHIYDIPIHRFVLQS
jgi:hypothetical protein